MKKLLFFITFLASGAAWAQVDLSYYFPPNVSLNPAIPTPQSVIGHQVGEWHITHDRLVNYMMALDKASDRVSLEVIGQSHEMRPILLLTITSPKNHQNLEAIRAEHALLSDPQKSGSVNVKNMPAVFYIGHSIHGNEASGANAALLTAYYLAAAQGPEIENYLSNTIILFDPSFNPDGLQRFSSWVNARKSKLVNADPNDVEHNEAWPGGRFNHYWFDLNRDWLVAQHPESQARVKKFHAWKPNVLTDHHEMGTNATFFFQPGVPSRMHPLTPEKNLELTKKIGAFHAKALDEIGSLYYTQEGYDDFYYGKGSTFPDVQGAIGILFEQASSRGHAQESVNGVLRFPFTIRNQFTTALSTLKAVNEMRVELLEYQREFYSNASAEAVKDPVKAIVVNSPKDKMKLFHFGEMLARQQIAFYKPAVNQTLAGKNVDTETGYVIPLNQPQYRLIKSMFEKRSQFKDSLFYDISSWTLPLAFGMDYEEQKVMPAMGERVTDLKSPEGKIIGKGDYAYVIEPFGYYVPRATYRLLSKNVRVKVATENFYADGKKFERGSLLISVDHQERLPDQLQLYMKEIAEKDGLDVYALATGLDFKGVSLGSPSFLSLKKPEIAMLVESGISPTDAGEIWHVLDTRYEIPVTLLPINVFNTTNINRYNTLIIPEGNYNAISESAKEKLKTWTQNGGLVIGFESAINWFQSTGLGKFEVKKDDDSRKDQKPKPYADIDENRGAQETSGAIFEADADLTNPLLYGFSSSKIALFKPNNIFLSKANGAYANPLTFGTNPLLSGYISKPNYARLKNSSSLGIAALGRGRVIGFTENLSFRAFWYGTNKIMMNAIFFGPLLSSEASR
ncbi:MAG: M14 metallopeptidase family protein [Cyclobacteriaceae bacterium]|nr:M14 family metallopeptidase [Flammeovirgaceae bacterium]